MRETRKFNLWVKYFMDKSNPDTYGNAVRSALKTYNTSNYHSAGQIGYENLKKLENMKLMIAENEGFGIAEFIKVALAKGLKGTYKDWEDLGIQLGYFSRKPEAQVNIQANYNFSNLGMDINNDRKIRGLQPI